ncbi:MAG: hypothetical protein QOG50_610, partial [Actinomycetota bacterium]|nr:hypothetical protein [Actinomycetota bacterium]
VELTDGNGEEPLDVHDEIKSAAKRTSAPPTCGYPRALDLRCGANAIVSSGRRRSAMG